MRVECHDMGEDAAEREGLSGFAQSVDERIIPGGAVPDVTENTMQFGIGLVEPLQHRFRGALRFGRAVPIHIGSGQRGGPDLSFAKTPTAFRINRMACCPGPKTSSEKKPCR